MARFKLGSPRGLFLVLSLGGGISLALMLSSIWLTERQKVYSDAINNAGRLRYMTERFGSLLMFEKLQRDSTNPSTVELVPSNIVFQDIDSIFDQLMGRDPETPTKFHDAPEVPDADIKNAFIAWQKTLHALNETGNAISSDPLELARFQHDVIEVVDALDAIVSLLSGKAQEWISIVLVLHVVRVAWQAFFYFWLTLVFKWIWFPFVKTFNDLRNLEEQQHSLLRADFDAVVEISTCHPFEVRRSCKAFDDIVGRAMVGESILYAVVTESGRAALAAFLAAGVSRPAQHVVSRSKKPSMINRLRCLCRGVQILAWPNMEESACYESPLAAKINSQMTCDVELLIVGKVVEPEEESFATLAIRQVGDMIRESSECADTSCSRDSSNDFLSYVKALTHVNHDEDEIILNLGSNIIKSARPRCNTDTTSSSSFNSRPSAGARRKMKDLDHVEVILGSLSQLQSYSLGFCQKDLDQVEQVMTSGRLDFLKCLVGKTREDFLRWWQESVNTIMASDSLNQLDYHGEVWFRPPTAARTSSKIVLCADSARCTMVINEDGSDDTWSLQFFGISQLTNRALLGSQAAAPRLPVLHETNHVAL